jgi:hypothetical protein
MDRIAKEKQKKREDEFIKEVDTKKVKDQKMKEEKQIENDGWTPDFDLDEVPPLE